ncbi:hypothetical protein QJQ45_018311 [Haematococcus lacustris]|nr:hypothetical protein QJQ45_018311 [Haematococcus lacustris]
MFTGELWDPGQAVINTMALEAHSQAPGSEASTSSGLRPSKADLQQTISSEEKHSPNTRSSLRFTKAIGPGDRDMSTEQDIRRCAVRPSFLEPREPVDVRWIRREKLPRTRYTALHLVHWVNMS